MFLFLLIGLMGFLYSFSSIKNGIKKVGTPIVEFMDGENQFLTHNMVNKLLIQNKIGVKNQAKTVIDLYKLENNIIKNPYVAKASVFLTIDGTLKVTIKQREPVARIIDNSLSYYVDKEGVKVPLSANYSARVILVSGIKKDKDIIEIKPLISYILNDEFLKKEVVGIEKSEEKEYKISVRSGDYKIDFGKLINVDFKFCQWPHNLVTIT